MLTIILNWIYILFTIFCMGFVFSRFVEKVLHYTIKSMVSILVAGLSLATVYAQVFSLFYRVNVEANAVMIVFCLVACVVMRKRMYKFISEVLGNCPLPCKILVPVLFLVWSYFTSRGYRTPDMDLYYGQSIRWIEEYGVVKGLGNLHSRFAYNSAIFSVSALYSMKFLLGRSLHAVNGLMAFIMSLGALKLGKCFRRKKLLLSDYARMGSVYYLTLIWDEVLAPSSDYAVMLTLFFIIIKWLEQLEDEENRDNAVPYALLCVVAVYALTLKVTAGLILILVLKPAYMLIRKKRWKEIGIYLLLGLMTAVPWMIRTVIISGWLLYPFAGLDLFSVDWKIDEGIVRTDEYSIKIWGKGANQLPSPISFKVWFPHWLNKIRFTERVLILADWVLCAVTVATAGIVCIRKKWHELDAMLVICTVMCCFLYWQLSAPLLRYGYTHVILMAVLPLGYFLEKLPLRKAAYVCMLLYGGYKLCLGGRYVIDSRLAPFYVWQETYGDYELVEYEIEGISLYYSAWEGVTGYSPFPSAPTKVDLQLLGEDLKDGFLLRKSEE